MNTPETNTPETNTPELDAADFTLKITWRAYTDGKVTTEVTTDHMLHQASMALHLMEGSRLWPTRIESDCPDFAFLLRHLSPLAIDGIDELPVNDVLCVLADVAGTNEHALTPMGSNGEGLEHGLVCHGETSWENDSMMLVWAASEALFSLGNIYWLEAWGDCDPRQVVAGYFDDENEGIKALVALSDHFSFDADGEVVGSDDWNAD